MSNVSINFFMSKSAGVSRQAENIYPTSTPCPCSKFSVESELFSCFCYFVCMILVTLLLLFLCVSVCLTCLAFVPGLYSFDFRYYLGSPDISFMYDNLTMLDMEI